MAKAMVHMAVYNPIVRALREGFEWFPMPEFQFGVWLAGLIALVIGLALLTPLAPRGPRVIRLLTIAFAVPMVLNGVAHVLGTIAGRTVSSVPFARPMPGFWSSPILVAAAVHFLARVHATGDDGQAVERTALRSVDQYNLLETYRVLGEFVEKHGLDKRHPAIRRASLYVLRHRSADGDIRGIYGTQYSPNYTAAIGGSGRPYRCSGATWTPHDESPARPARNRVTDVVSPCSSPRVVRGTRRGSPATRSERGLALYAATVSVRGLTPAPARVSPRPSSSAAR